MSSRAEVPDTPPESIPALVAFFKALAEPTRLRIVGLLSAQSLCGLDLAKNLGLTPATVSHHLRILRDAGLVTEERQAPFSYYALDRQGLTRTLRSVARREQVASLIPEREVPRDRGRVLHAFFEGNRLRAIPAQRRKKEIVFEEILRRLPRRREYSERELSAMLKEIHPDFCTIRREFIMGRYMEREGGVYRMASRGRSVLAKDG